MIKYYTILIFCWILYFPLLSFSQYEELRVGDTIYTFVNDGKIECRLRHNTSVVPQNQNILENSKGNSFKASRISNANFEVKFIGFPVGAEAAVQKAIDIWSANLKSPIKINIFANWTVLQNSNTLAFVVPTEVRNFSEAPKQNVWYPITLAEKLQSANLNSIDEADIVATFNAGRNDWYFGTDGNCPIDKFDLVTIALHELGHGLGFSGTFFVNNGSGTYGASGTTNPKIYDTYIKNGSGNFLFNTFANGSFELGSQLTSNSLVFDSPLSITLTNGGSNPRIFAPNPFNPGSSISHLDENTYSNTDDNLMTPFAGLGEVQHSPGRVVKGIFYDMGWINTYLSHLPLKDVESLTGNNLSLTIKADTTLRDNSVRVFYTVNGGALQEQTLEKSEDLWITTFENLSFNSTISYFFKVEDVFGREFRLPKNNNQFYNFFYGTDLVKPIITHSSLSEFVSLQKHLEIQASVTDNLGLGTVIAEYSINGGTTKTVDLEHSMNDLFFGVIDLSDENLKGGDVLNYRLKAIDASSQQNTSLLPSAGNFSVKVRLFEERTVYANDFNNEDQDFFGNFSSNVQTGFVNGAMHSPHPYSKSGDIVLKDFSHILLYPIVIKDESSFMDFDEVVLVNPSDGDYVIIEASADEGVTWNPITSQYTSAHDPDWLTRFNSNIQLGDSKALGSLNIFKQRRINLLEFLNPGDKVFFRFRLRTNQTGNGWGWVIDNLKIQDVVLSNSLTYSENSLFPNPVRHGYFHFYETEGLDATLHFYDSTGKLVKQSNLDHTNRGIDVSDLPSGIYFVKFKYSNRIQVLKFVVSK
jgi:hypothetical protein